MSEKCQRSLRSSHTTLHTGPYTAVREVAQTRFDQVWKTEQFEVGVGSPTERALLRAMSVLVPKPEIAGPSQRDQKLR
jgi:hypothetical protein